MSSQNPAVAGTGVSPNGEVHSNLTTPALVGHALRRGEGRLSADGAFIAVTGQHTGRSVQDKFVVDEPDRKVGQRCALRRRHRESLRRPDGGQQLNGER